ncbi:MAG: SLBB domain-containing protein [Pirellulaceae bacterium]
MKTFCTLIALLTLLSGCTSTANYNAANLPQQLAAPPNFSARKVDLSALAGSIQPADQLAVGDAVTLSIATGVERGGNPEWTLRVAEDGTLNVPLVGPVLVAGLKLTDAERAVAAEAVNRGVYVSPNVTMQMEQRRSNRVTVMGAVVKPQTYELPVGASDLMTAISMAEGFTDDANTTVQVRHPPGSGAKLSAAFQNRQVAFNGQAAIPPVPDQFEIDLNRINEVPMPHRQLVDGSVLVVEEKPDRFVNVMGLVRSPDAIEMPKDEDMKLLDAISQAGGLSESLANRVTVIRKRGDEDIVIETSIREAKQGGAANLVLAPNDLVSVEETPLTYTVGTLKTFIRFGFSSAVPF